MANACRASLNKAGRAEARVLTANKAIINKRSGMLSTVEPVKYLLPHVANVRGAFQHVPLAPVADEPRSFTLAVQGDENLFALLEGDVVHISLDDHQRCVDAIHEENR